MERSQHATAATKRGADFSVRFADPTRKRNEKVWRPEATALDRFSPIVIPCGGDCQSGNSVGATVRWRTPARRRRWNQADLPEDHSECVKILGIRAPCERQLRRLPGNEPASRGSPEISHAKCRIELHTIPVMILPCSSFETSTQRPGRRN